MAERKKRKRQKDTAAWVNEGKKAPGMHIHKAIKDGTETWKMLRDMSSTQTNQQADVT